MTWTSVKYVPNQFPSEGVQIQLTPISTDPSSVDIYLVNNAVFPPVSKKLGSDVETSAGSFTVTGLSGVSDGYVLLQRQPAFLLELG